MTATVETVAEQLDLAAIMPSEKVVTAVARSVTLSEADVGMKHFQRILKNQLFFHTHCHNLNQLNLQQQQLFK